MSRAAVALGLVLLAAPSFATQEVAPARAFAAQLHSEVEELFPDRGPATGSGAELVLHTPRGVAVAVHVLVQGARALSFDVVEDGEPVEGVAWYRMVDVPVEENTGLVSRTEIFDGKTNPHVIRRAPFRIFEALAPVTPPLAVGEADIVALRVELPIPADAAPGARSFEVVVAAGEEVIPLPWTVHVHDAVVPAIGAATLGYTNWFSPAKIAADHGLELWSEEFWGMLGRYAALMAKGRQNTFWVRWSDVFAKNEKGLPQLDRRRLERYVRTFTDAGLHTIEGAPFAGRPGGDWGSKTLQLSIVDLPATSDDGRGMLALMCSQLRAAIDENGWRDRWIQHLSDEPTDTNAADYRELSGIFRMLLPGIPIIEATMSTQLAGAVDIWCPQVQEYQRHRDFFEERRAAGDRRWVYTCLIPGGPWINRLLDQERLRQVYVGWAAARYDLDGFLHWGLNHHRVDPFQRSVVDHGPEPNTKNRLPAGDSHIVYPGPDGPWSSHRFEAHRLGMEDRELLRQLAAKDRALHDALVAKLFRAFDDYEKDVAAYLDVKRALLEALDE